MPPTTSTKSGSSGKSASKGQQQQPTEMIINYVPGEECRVAMAEGGRLEEFHAERMDNVSHVGNIYVGKVMNVEAGIQAAFIDFGLEANGFLHVTDLHPRYFPGEDDETTERVGKKTPRRERPPIQACLRRGQEIAVQVLKEGVGTKGPTVTSYLSIPGRFLVMMPLMDKVGVSRKVEDEEQRRKMREILDQLDLPEGFGFILRTAGMDQNKTELKRDLAYLQRLWKDMEKRWKTGSKPRLLYSESDLLVRALRDMLSTEVERIVVDNESALNRAARFLKIVAPRTTTKLASYTGKTPIFHAMGIEQQIQMIHAREVPLPSGGRLVIDETEALVAIDVNSGRMRDAKDAETTAYRTNMEAADEIARQLRLRDVGGVIMNDFIDMRALKHRRELEQRFKDNLKKDRARTTTAPVSPFGVIEMTRQRMRGSHESQHFATCPSCRGRGLLQRPDSVAADALRELTSLLDHDRVFRVEMVVHPRIAGELLSTKRKALSRVERTMAKKVDVRVSDAIAVDRVTFYAYDERGADIDAAKLDVRKLADDALQPFVTPDAAEWAVDLDLEDQPEPEEPVQEEAVIEPLHPIEVDDLSEPDTDAGDAKATEPGGGDRRKRRRRGGRGRGKDHRAEPSSSPQPAQPKPATGSAAGPLHLVGEEAESQDSKPGESGNADGTGGRKRRRRRRRGGRGGETDAPIGATSTAPRTVSDADEPHGGAELEPAREDGVRTEGESQDGVDAEPMGEGTEGGRRRRRRRRGGRGRAGNRPDGVPDAATDTTAAPTTGGRNEARPTERTDTEQPSGNHDDDGGPDEPRKRRRRRGGRGRRGGGGEGGGERTTGPGAAGGGASANTNGTARAPSPAPATPPAQPAGGSGGKSAVQVRPRTLYGVGRRKLTPAERKAIGGDE